MAAFTKQHYEQVAAQYKKFRVELIEKGNWTAGGAKTLARTLWEDMVDGWVHLFKLNNPERFDEAKFRAACEPEVKKPVKKGKKRVAKSSK